MEARDTGTAQSVQPYEDNKPVYQLAAFHVVITNVY